MHWLTAHLYVVLVAVVGFSIVATSAVIVDRGPVLKAEYNGNWGRVGGLSFTQGQPEGLYIQPLSHESVMQDADIIPYSVISIQKVTDASAPALLDEWNSLLSQLSDEGHPVSATPSETTDAYAYIPHGLISAPDTTEQKTEIQVELFDYGNRIGSLIRAFDEAHTSMIPTLKDAYTDRTNTIKRAAAEKIGEDYIKLGKEIEAIPDVPAAVTTMHKAIARAYQDAGEKMITKLRAETDEEFLAAMHAYNASASKFIDNAVALATYFSAAGVRFSQTDAGSVFTFTAM